MEIRERLSAKIREVREHLGWSQARLALEASVPQSTISEIEQGQRIPRTDTTVRLATALGVTVSELLDEDVRPTGTDRY